MEGGIQKSELQLELSCGFDNYEIKRERCARKQSPQKLLRDLKQLQIQRNQSLDLKEKAETL